MPNIKDATDWQREVLSAVAKLLGIRPEYTGIADDCYKFTQGTIFGYLKLIAKNTRSLPPAGVKVIVEEKFWSQIRDDLQPGNDWYGKPSRHILMEASDPNAVATAAAVLSEARKHAARK